MGKTVFSCLLLFLTISETVFSYNSNCESNFLENATSTLHKLDNDSRAILVDVLQSFGYNAGDLLGVTFGSSGTNRKSNHCRLYGNITKYYTINGSWHDTPYPWCQVRIQFYFYDKNNKSTKVDKSQIDLRNGDLLINFNNKSRPIFVLIHGFLQETLIPEWAMMAKDMLIKLGYDVIIVSWDSISVGLDYSAAIADARLVADTLAALLRNMINTNVTLAEKLILVGHSLGAHISAIAAGQISNLRGVIALDPAGPFFDCRPDVGLGKNVAQFVQVLHTDFAGVSHFGSNLDRGHVDFYVNDKNDSNGVQPGCLISEDTMISLLLQKREKTACSHNRAIQIFLQAVRKKCIFKAKRGCKFSTEVFSPKRFEKLTKKDFRSPKVLGRFEIYISLNESRICFDYIQ